MELEEFAQACAQALNRLLEETAPGVGFTLFLIQKSNPGWSTYISSFERQGMLVELEMFLERMKRDPSSIENPRNGEKPL